MAATASVNRPPPAHPGPNVGNLPSHSGLPNPGQQDPGLNGTSQDPGPPFHPQHHAPVRPVFYVPAPPPPPFLQYQWPMPFPYNPFAGFPGMGYGMVMPPFPPPPYMEAPTYILPHPHIQPVDYRRLLHPQVQAPSVPYQNPNQLRRIRLPTVPVYRETVNSAVQTEPTQRGVGGYSDGSPHIRSDSGHGTASVSPSSSGCSSQKRGSVEVENYTLPTCNAKDVQVNGTSTNGTVGHELNNPHLKGIKAVQSRISAPGETQKCRQDSVGQENVPHFRNGHCNMWSVSSQDSMVPVCSSSQQEDEVAKERRASVPDILMSWGGGTPQAVVLKIAAKGLHQKDQQLPSYETEVETEKSLYDSPTEPKNCPVVADSTEVGVDADNVLSSKDSETLFKIVKLPFALHDLPSSRRESEPVGSFGSVRQCLTYKDEMLHSPKTSHMLPDDEQENGNESNPHEVTTEINPYQMSSNSNPMKRRMNESVWSVESLAPFIPAKEWLLQKSTFEPEIIIEMTEEAENGELSTQSDNLIVKSSKRRLSRKFSFSDAGATDSWLIYNSPGESSPKKPEIQCEIDVYEDGGPQQCLSTAPSEKDPLVSPTALQSKMILSFPTEEDVDENRSSEPEANRSPNQESVIVIEQQEKSPCSPEQERTLLLISVAGEKISPSDQLILQNGVDMDMEVDVACASEEVSQLRNEQLCVPMADQRMAKVSPSKGHLVDSGIQCTNLQDCETCKQPACHMEPGTRPLKKTDVKRANGGKAEGYGMNGHGHKNQRRNGPYRNRGQENPSGQQEAYHGYYGKPGRSRGGNGRNHRYER
ncbi:uncharacterized protein [Pagrus major]|uniref:uncharacterized protein n=1 Tax=Pagrus major TaxID=143350 RepID=UPI003CC8CEF6